MMNYYLMPHPPIMIPEVGKGEEQKIKETIKACQHIAKEIATQQPETIIIITPHGPVFSDAIALSGEQSIKGDLSTFQAASIRFEKQIDLDLVHLIVDDSKREQVSSVNVNNSLLNQFQTPYHLDHGSMVPLYFIDQEYSNYKLVHITYGMLSDIDLYKFGMIIKQSVEKLNRHVTVIASGDLSHRLTEDGPYSYSPQGKVFDQTLLSHLEKGEVEEVFLMDKGVIEEAGECGYRSILILLGALQGKTFRGDLLSYEGTFGVGYGVMRFAPSDVKYDALQSIIKQKKERKINQINHSDDYVKIARLAIEHYLKDAKSPNIPEELPDEMINQKAGVFVSLKKDGQLRGCIGTFLPTKESIAEEIMNNAVEAAMHDPRFDEVEAKELIEIDISVDILERPEYATIEDLDPLQYGVIVTQGVKKGLLLPNLEGITTVEEQLRIACNKASINPNKPFTIERFKVTRHIEGNRDE